MSIDYEKILKKRPIGSGTYSKIYPVNKKKVLKSFVKGSPDHEEKVYKLLESWQDKIPGIPSLYHRDKNYLVLTRYDTDLFNWLTTSTALSPVKRSNHLVAIIFQVLKYLEFFQRAYPGFRHNDLKADNVLLDLTSHPEKRVSNWRIPKDYPVIGISDFDYTNIPKILENKKVRDRKAVSFGAGPEACDIYDLHLFLNSLYIKKILLPKKVRELIERTIPEIYRGNDDKNTKFYRLIHPEKVKMKNVKSLLKDDMFKRFYL